MSWTAPGDDGGTGTASVYIIKYSTSAITTDALFNSATDVVGEPAPAVAGSTHNITVSGLTPGTTYYFAMKTQDEVPNTSVLSNSASAVAKSNTSPVLAAIGNKSVNENTALSFTVSGSDADGDTLTYSTSALPTGATFTPATRTFAWTPSYSQSGSYSLTFTVSDGHGGSDTETITITVNNVNRAPILGAIGNKTVAEASVLSFTVTASDPDGGALTLSASNLPSGATFTSATGVFSWTPSLAQAGTYTLVHFAVSDGSLTDTEDITITVTGVNQAPVLAAVGNKTVAENASLAFSLSASDGDGNTLSYSGTGLPSGATLNSSTGAFAWTPSYAQSGSYSTTFTVSDGNGGTDSEAITITVNNLNRAPVLAAVGNKTGAENTALTFTLSATDADSDVLTYSATGLPAGASLNSSTGAFSWTPGYTQAGSYSVTFTVTDTSSAVDSEAISITVSNTNQAPVLAAIGSKSVEETSALAFTVSASDADGDSLTYSSSALPSGASFSNRNFSWTPSGAQIGSYNITFTVTDAKGGTDSEVVAITVNPVDVIPPYVEELTPEEEEVQVDKNTSVSFHVKDTGKGVDVNTLSMSVKREGDAAAMNIIVNGVSQLAATYPTAVAIQGTPSNYIVKYQPPSNKTYKFTYEQEVVVTVNAKDLNGNLMATKTFSFTTAMLLRGKNLKISWLDRAKKLGSYAMGFWAGTAEAAENLTNSAITIDKSNSSNVYAAWQDNLTFDIWTAKSTDRGKVFNTKIKISEISPGTNQKVEIATDVIGNTYLVWQNQAAAGDWNLYFAKRARGSNTFQVGLVPIDNILGANSEQVQPSIDANVDGSVVIAWVNQGGTNNGVYYARSTDAGNSFWNIAAGQVKRVDDGTQSGWTYPVVKTDAAGTSKFVAWSATKSGKKNIFFNKLNSSDTRAYSSDLQVSDSATCDNATRPALAVPPVVGTVDAYICCAWENAFGGDTDIFFDRSLDGSSWGVDVQVNDDSTPPLAQKEPEVAVDQDGSVYVVWSDFKAGDWDIYLSLSNNKGQSFKTNMLVNDDPGTPAQEEPAMYLSANGAHLCLSWSDKRDGNSLIYFNRNSFFDEDNAAESYIDNLVGGTLKAEGSSDISGAEVIVPINFMDVPVTLSITNVESVPPRENDAQIVKAIDFGPSGITFNKLVTIKIPYTSADLAIAGISDPRRLKIFFYNLKTLLWEKLSISEVDTVSQTVSAQVSHFSLYGLADGGAEGAVSVGGGGGGGGGGCFIATAAYGSYEAGDVRILRIFRDRCLLKNKWGSMFVKAYYKVSPPIAHCIEKNGVLKALVRWSLKPLVFVANEAVSW